MNKLIRIFIFMFIISIIFTACKKDTELQVQQNLDPTEQKILNFIEKMESGDKSGEAMSVDDVVWYIEAALNYAYCNNEANEVIAVDSVFVTVVVSETGSIDYNNIVIAYDQIEENLINVLGENSMRIADIEFVESNNKNDEETLKLTTVITNGWINVFNFDETDFWYPLWEDGKCGAYQGQNIGYDAKTQLQNKINHIVAIELPYGYATDVETVWAGIGFETGDENYFWQGYDNECIAPNNMNLWLDKGVEISDIKKPTTKQLVSCIYHWDMAIGGGNYYFHLAEFKYGIWHSQSVPDPND